MVGIIAERDGVLYVRYESRNYGDPTLVRLWWKVKSIKRNPYNMAAPSVGDAARYESVADRPWSTSREGIHSTGSVWTEEHAAITETEPVPPPRVRKGVQVRWHDGRWEKLMARGWVLAEGVSK